MEKVPKVPAFKEQLKIKEEYSSTLDGAFLYKVGDRDDVVVRSLDWMHFLEKGYFRPAWKGESISAEEFAQISKQHFDELASYGVVAPVSFLVAEKERVSEAPIEEVFAVVANVQKTDDAAKDQRGGAFLDLRKSLLRYYTAKFERNESFLADLFKESQYVYGKLSGDVESHIYLVDVEPFIYGGPKALRTILRDLIQEVDAERAYFALPEYDTVCDGFRQLYDRVNANVEAL